jgi:hypothetical protein
MGTIQGMLDEARHYLGVGERTENSNTNVFTDWYGLGAMPWCDAFISYVGDKSGNGPAIGRFAWTPSHAQWFKSHGQWVYGLSGVRVGDIVFFDWSGTRLIGNIDHIGVVESVRSDGTIVTIEGNTDNVVARRVRNSSVVVGYGRPLYSNAAPMPSSDGILRRGSTGDLVKKLQTDLNVLLTKVVVGGPRLDVDGEFGVATENVLKAFQKYAHLDVDGEYGPASAAALKGVLAGQPGPIVPAPVVHHPPAKLAVDGEIGPKTNAALQRFLNTHGEHLGIDGVRGPATNRALQRFLGVNADGVVGKNTVKALQKWVGSNADGAWGPDTTRHLQLKLNSVAV